MFKLDWEINGRRIQPGQLATEVTNALKAEALNEAKRTVAEVRCPVHGTQPTAISVEEAAGRLRFQYEACCDRLTAAVEEAFQ